MRSKINLILKKFFRPVSELTEDPKNARAHNERNIRAIEESLRLFGQQKPIVANEKGIVVAGNGVLTAARNLGWKEIAVLTFDSKDPHRQSAYAIADNRPGELADWNREVLTDVLKELEGEGYDLEKQLAFSKSDLADILAEMGKAETKETPVPALAKKTYVKRADLWALGSHRILCGDATEQNDMRHLMGEEKADMVFTDPPYNVDYGSSKTPGYKIRKIEGDNLSNAEWDKFNRSFITNILNHYSGGDIYIWGSSGPNGMRQRLILVEMDFHWSATIIWKKQQLIFSASNYQRIYESCFYGWYKKSTFHAGRKEVEVWEIHRPFSSIEHPTMKPAELVMRAILNSSLQGDICLDPFLGAGGTVLACEQTGRRGYGMEIVPGYVQVTIERWRELTGQKAELVKHHAKT